MRLQKLRHVVVPALLLTAIVIWPRAAEAQRGPARGGAQPASRVVVHAPVRGPVYRPAYIRPCCGYGYGLGYGYPYYGYGVGFGYPYYGWGFGFGFSGGAPWYPYAYPFGYPYGYYGAYDNSSAIRLEVTPRTTEVFVDGYAAGTVDSYDGFFQRLRVGPGEHEITLYLDGYRAVHQRLHLSSGGDQKVRYTMVPLPAGEQPEPRPQPPAVSEDEQENQRPGPPSRGMAQGRGGPPPMRQQPGEPPAPSGTFGSLSIRVQPADAEVTIDGERWTGPANQERLIVQLSGGRHRVEIQKAGFERYANDVEVRSGETVTLNISLLRRN